MSRIRCFVAVALPPAVCGALADLQRRLQTAGLAARWVRPAALHLTVRFLGELPPAAFDRVVAEFARPLASSGPLRLVPTGVSTFPPGPRARVVWAGLTGAAAALARVAQEVEARVQRCGLPGEGRPFHPHLTLGRSPRLGGLGEVAAALQCEAAFAAPAFWVRELVLYESRLHPQGARYLPRFTLPLSGDPIPD